MRITAGEFGSRKLNTLPGNATRPTLDKVKEALFSMTGPFFEGGRILDLYAGSGAIGLEGLSRGMNEAVFADKSHEACSIIRSNIELLKVQERCRLLHTSAKSALEILAREGVKFDYVYLDPPYAKQQNLSVMEMLQKNEMLNENAFVVIESDAKQTYPELTGGLVRWKEPVYGITRLSIYRFHKETDAE